ncbi:hypothetical protein LSAT2_010165, partial [Lamellibrachia satsuma]
TPEEYYRRAITVPFQDDILQQLNTRFTQGQQLIERCQRYSICKAPQGKTWTEDFHDALPSPNHWMRK